MFQLLASFVFIVGIVHRANGNTCTWTWTDPSGSTTLTRSVGAPTTFAATVSGAALADGNTISLKIAGTVIHDATWAASSSTFTDATNTLSSVLTRTAGSASDSNTYSFAFPTNGLRDADDGAVTMENAACTTSGTASSAITLTVKYCNLATYGDLATATDATDNCGYNCERTFTCGTDSTTTFTSTCQADATWSVPYACDVCPGATSAGVKEVAILALVMFCSALSATHLM